MRAIYWAAVLVVAAILGLFAVSNREAVTLGLWPLPYLVDVPLYLAVFVSLLGGFIVGAAAAWLGGRRGRRELRRCRRRSEALARELAVTQQQLAGEAETAVSAIPATR